MISPLLFGGTFHPGDDYKKYCKRSKSVAEQVSEEQVQEQSLDALATQSINRFIIAHLALS